MSTPSRTLGDKIAISLNSIAFIFSFYVFVNLVREAKNKNQGKYFKALQLYCMCSNLTAILAISLLYYGTNNAVKTAGNWLIGLAHLQGTFSLFWIVLIDVQILHIITPLDNRFTGTRIKKLKWFLIIAFWTLNMYDFVITFSNLSSVKGVVVNHVDESLIGIWGAIALIYDNIQSLYIANLFFQFNKKNQKNSVIEKYYSILIFIGEAICLDLGLLVLLILGSNAHLVLGLGQAMICISVGISSIHCSLMSYIFFGVKSLAFAGSSSHTKSAGQSTGPNKGQTGPSIGGQFSESKVAKEITGSKATQNDETNLRSTANKSIVVSEFNPDV